MAIKGRFEYPMTKVVASINKIAEEVNEVYNGSFSIKNLGGGLLSGNIMTDNDIISFEETEFEENEFEIRYCIDVRNSEPNKLLKFNVYIISNGGELTIPVFIKVLKNVFYTADGFKISTIKDLFSYFKKKPKKAVDVFYSSKFMKWLKKTGFENIDMAKMFLKDTCRERAIDNFFVFCKLKKRAYIDVSERNINMYIKPFQKDKISGSIVILKKGYGYINKNITMKNDDGIVKLKKSAINSNDFDAENRCYTEYEIDSQKIFTNYYSQDIVIDENTIVKLNVYKLPKIKVELSEEIYDYEDFGSIYIENNCEKELVFELSAKDGFIEFESRHCIISEKENISFKIKRSKIQHFMNKVSFNKKLYTESEIYVKTVFDNKIIKKTKKVFLGIPLL